MMRLKSILLAGITSTLTLASLSFTAGSAEAKAWRLPENYQGPVCITGRAQGNVSIKWGDWSHSFNGRAIREEGAFNYGGPIMGGDHPAIAMGKAGVRLLSEADKNVARMQPYNIELTSRGAETIINVSDSTATVRRRACNWNFKVQR